MRLYRPVMLGLGILAMLLAMEVWLLRWGAFAAAGAVGIDYRNFADYGRLLISTGSPYRDYQLAGPYDPFDPALLTPTTQPNLYPPPFAIVGVALNVLPWPLWWAVPLALVAWCAVSWRPAPWSWPLLALFLASPATSSIVIVGGTTMVATALLAAGLRWGWPASLLVLKPTFAPLAVVGVRRRSFWIAVVVMGAVSLILLPLWPEYLQAVRNAEGLSLLYSIGDAPMLAIPLVAWAARTDESARSPSSGA